MKARREFLPLIAGSLAGIGIVAVTGPSHACRYCEMAMDPEAYRFMTERRSGSAFPLDSGDGSYGGNAGVAPAPAAAAPSAANLVTSVTDLQRLTPHQTAAADPVASPTLPAAPRRIPPEAPSFVELRNSPPPPAAAAVGQAGESASVRLADFGLAGIVGALLFFAWRTRRRRQQPATA